MNIYIERFKDGIRRIGYDPQDVINNWRYFGGDYDSHLKYYIMVSNNETLPQKEHTCVCGQKIKRNCYLEKDSDIIVLGSCCIKRFINKSSRTCSVCGANHKNRKHNFCNLCKDEEYRYKYLYEQIYKKHNYT